MRRVTEVVRSGRLTGSGERGRDDGLTSPSVHGRILYSVAPLERMEAAGGETEREETEQKREERGETETGAGQGAGTRETEETRETGTGAGAGAAGGVGGRAAARANDTDLNGRGHVDKVGEVTDGVRGREAAGRDEVTAERATFEVEVVDFEEEEEGPGRLDRTVNRGPPRTGAEAGAQSSP